jgi:hypothetical protein
MYETDGYKLKQLKEAWLDLNKLVKGLEGRLQLTTLDVYRASHALSLLGTYIGGIDELRRTEEQTEKT